MAINLLDRVDDWNPQLLRELKGRLKGRNIAIAVAISLLGYLLMGLYGVSQIERLTKPHYYSSVTEPFCRLRETFLSAQQQLPPLQAHYRHLQAQFSRYSGSEHYNPLKIAQLKDQIAGVKGQIADLQKILGRYECPINAIDIQLWWQHQYGQMFAWLSIIVMLVLLVVGTYMLISDLAGEERRGTLNFIRFTPQSTRTILIGKLLGVPILLYLAAVLIIPLQLWLGWSAQLPLAEIASFWVVLVASCAFFYSGALLLGLVSAWLGGFQAWLGSGAVFIFLCIANNKQIDFTPVDWLNLFSPSVVLPYLFNQRESSYNGFPFSHNGIQDWTWFHLPVGAAGISLVFFTLFNYALWTGWIWQALNRRFHNPNTTILSKRQSYWLVGCFEAIILGFALQGERGYSDLNFSIASNIFWLAVVNIVLFLVLIPVLSPHRQALADWARYKHVNRKKSSQFNIAWQDWMFGEKSPALMAMAINLAIAATPFLIWIFLWPSEELNKTKAIIAVAFFASLTLICTILAQLMLMMKTSQRSLWATGTLAALLGLPPIMLGTLGVNASEKPNLWLFSTFPWAGIEQAGMTTIFLAFLAELSVLGLLSLKLRRQLRQAGESASKALLAERS
ncbi:MAG TPA: ABC transporter permease [Cyanobacteria bacterium UBA9273]|nr:ABC transporter permease [Cyanobacteria bacterium UBA9273]